MTDKKKPDKNNFTVITTHINADFDALASALAAQKLYPNSLIVFPVSNEKTLRNFFTQSVAYLFNMADIKDIVLSDIKRLVLVDTRQPGRIGSFTEIIDKPDLEIHIYDHHPSQANDVRGQFEIIRLTGATVTILTEIIRERKIEISPEEATIMCLGIYEDTGSFTFSSTTGEEFIAAAFLLSKGANLNIISDLMAREISVEQVGLLNDMIEAAVSYNINGIEVVITSVVTDRYISDFSFLVHKMMNMERLNAIVAIAQMDYKIYLVARSRIPEVDVGEIVSPFGGGGHTYAAAATVRGKTIAQTEQQLIGILRKKIRPNRRAKDLMSSPPITIDADVSCKAANLFLTRYNVNALLVTTKTDGSSPVNSLVGFISRQVMEKALYHGLDNLPVREYTTTEVAVVGPEAELIEIQEKIIESKQRILPVMEDGIIRGVITRTDLLNILVKDSLNKTGKMSYLLDEPSHAKSRNVGKFMKERLSKRIMDILASIGDTASKMGYSAYVVGGFVRDLFLYQANEDIDIVIEGDGIEFAKKYTKMMGARVHYYEKFGTAVVILSDGFKIDVASARLEYYKFPAALPTVEMSSIKLDLFRRDFTINTLTIQLNPDKFGTLIDFFAALRDIKEKTIRVLHNLSFVEDPTRVFRAIRFEQRFGFTIGKLTSNLIKNTVKMDFFSRLSGRRVFSELRQILEEENPIPAIMRLDDYNLLRVIHPFIEFTGESLSMLNSVKKVLSWYDLLFLEESYMKWVVYFLSLLKNSSRKISGEICLKLGIGLQYRTIFCKERIQADNYLSCLKHDDGISNSSLYSKLSVLKTETLLYMMAAAEKEKIKKTISFFFTQLRDMKISVTGKDLIGMGLEPGPIFKEIMRALFDAKLNGLLKNREEEFKFVGDYVSQF